MAAPSKVFTFITDLAIAANKAITVTLFTWLRDNHIHLNEWLGRDYVAAVNHNHDGVNSAPIAPGGGGVLRLLSTAQVTAPVAFVDIPIPPGYTKYLLSVRNYAVSGGGAELGVQTSSDGGVTIDNVAGQYKGLLVVAVAGGAYQHLGRTVDPYYNAGDLGGASTVGGMNAEIEIYWPLDATKFTFFMSRFTGVNVDSTNNSGGWTTSCRVATTAVNFLRVGDQTGANLTSGEFSLYGVQT